MCAALVMDFKALSDQACLAAEEFSRVYYNYFDKQRHLLPQLYLEESTVIWNGNAYQGRTKINELLFGLPATTHELKSLDCHAIDNIATKGHTTVMLVCEGHVTYGEDKKRKYFTQNFILMSENNAWKIVTDCFRLIDRE